MCTPATSDFDGEVRQVQAEIEKVRVQKRERLKNLDFFVLDNSIRESTVGQLRSHTLENKIEIYEEVKKCGFKDIIVASFAHMTRIDDDFVRYLADRGEDFENFYSFSEISEGIVNGAYDTKRIPVGLQKNKQFGLRHTVFEFDLADKNCEWGEKFTVEDMCQLLHKRFKWVYDNIWKDARILINFRDFV